MAEFFHKFETTAEIAERAIERCQRNGNCGYADSQPAEGITGVEGQPAVGVWCIARYCNLAGGIQGQMDFDLTIEASS